MRITPSRPAVRVFAPAKINWILTIRGRRPDGYHELDTIFQALNWGDELRCRPLTRRECRIHCTAPGIPLGPENLIARAWRLLAELFPERVGGLAVELVKRLPSGAGLGGGSSDAVAALKAVDRLYGLRLPPATLEDFAARLGSDCAFFVRGGTARGEGRGEILTPLANRLPPLWLVVVHPGFSSPTAQAYRNVGPEHYDGGQRVTEMIRILGKGDIDCLKSTMDNIFSGLIPEFALAYNSIKDTITGNQLACPMLAGSGSAMFAFARDRAHAHRAAERLRQCYPIAVAATLRRIGARVLPE